MIYGCALAHSGLHRLGMATSARKINAIYLMQMLALNYQSHQSIYLQSRDILNVVYLSQADSVSAINQNFYLH